MISGLVIALATVLTTAGVDSAGTGVRVVAAAATKPASKKTTPKMKDTKDDLPPPIEDPVTTLPPPATTPAPDGNRGATGSGDTVLTIDDCVRIALESNARIFEAEGRVHEYASRLAEVQALFYPRIQGMAFLAPMYTVRGDIYHHETEWKSISDWGPYAHLQATLSQPIYTFGRSEAAKLAASERAEVERARLRETQNVIAWETRKLYYTHLYARSLIPTLEQGHQYVGQALERAQELYDTGTGEVAQSDLSRLRFSIAQVERFTLVAKNGADIALVALKHTMGMAANANLRLADDHLQPLPDDAPTRELATYIAEAAANRPEWQQLAHGKSALHALSVAEIKANLPILAIAGQFNADWAPTRDNTTNPYWSDNYNRIVGGLALALAFDLNPWAAQAKQQTASAQYEQLDALERFASTGIPLQVQNAWTNLEQARAIVTIANNGIQATRKWVTFAANAYDTGTGEPRDLLEGLAALIESRRMMYDSLRDYYLARAELLYSTGTH